MSSDKDSVKAEESKVEEESKNEDTRESKDESGDVLSDASVEKEKKKEPTKREAAKKKSSKVKQEISDDNESADDEAEDDDDRDDSSGQKVPLLDQPLQLSGTRDRKKVERFTEDFSGEPKELIAVEIPKGKGKKLGEIAIIESMIKRKRTDALKVLHRILFNRIGKPELMKTNILKFNGFEFDKESDLFEKKQTHIGKLEFSALKDICTVLDLEKKGNRKQIAERIVQFLVQPADSGKPAPKLRPTRGTAMKAIDKGYSESEPEEDVEKQPARSRSSRTKRTSLKNEDTDGEAVDSKKVKNSTKEAEEDPPTEEEGPLINEEESDEPKSKKKKGRQTSNAKKAPPKKTSAKKAPPKKSNKKSSTKKRKMENGSEEESSEDEPLMKKSKAPPTDDEIKTYVKEILEGANLEEITMKTVCKQVYAHYPEFDLAHKKDFIKATVKSLIST